jgi:hypothetical protein
MNVLYFLYARWLSLDATTAAKSTPSSEMHL